ncbi:DUF503 domain-containing protein [Candidatus Desantisbacteria bacterium]|nr:DUF503 domain-containing protein [Candidatus Desantisbacteria bacterium]
MIIGTVIVEFYIHQSHSLKDKRRVLKSIIAQIRNKFNVSVAEIDLHELWGRALIGIACVSNDTKYANQVLSQIINMIENEITEAEMVSHRMEIW